jgi:PIN domain nuclease of toxin-antitoxin system
MPKADALLVLDTHVWIWLMEGSERLSVAARERIQQGVRAEALRVAAISVWEAAMLEAKGRIVFDEDCAAWVRRALGAPGLSLFPLTPEVAIASTRLPGTFQGDPADRMIVATARASGATLVTADSAILRYAASGHLRVLPASVSP